MNSHWRNKQQSRDWGIEVLSSSLPLLISSDTTFPLYCSSTQSSLQSSSYYLHTSRNDSIFLYRSLHEKVLVFYIFFYQEPVNFLPILYKVIIYLFKFMHFTFCKYSCYQSLYVLQILTFIFLMMSFDEKFSSLMKSIYHFLFMTITSCDLENPFLLSSYKNVTYVFF